MLMMHFPAGKLFGLVSCMFLVGVLFFSCEQDSIVPSAIDTSYFPLQTGKYIIYDVDSVVYSNFFNTTDSFSFQVMEYIDSSYTDAGNEEAYRIVRSRRESDPPTLRPEIREGRFIRSSGVAADFGCGTETGAASWRR